MNRIIKVFSVQCCILLLLPFGLTARAVTSGQESYTPSAEALAAIERFKASPDGRKYDELAVLIKELRKDGGDASAGGPAEYRAIPRQQILDLLGPPPSEVGKDVLVYNHHYGTTSFFFEENDRLKDVATLWEPNIWYALPRQSAPKRLWYRAVRWAHKLKRVFT